MTKAIARTEFIIHHIRANSSGTYDREKAELLFDWLVKQGYIKEKEEV